MVALLFSHSVHAKPIATGVTKNATDPIAVFVAEAAEQAGIPVSWIWAVIRVESGGNVHALSPKGAMGLMQLMPDTWSSLRLRYGLAGDPFDAHDNILAGADYLRELRDRYGSPGFLAAYNAGPARYENYLATGQGLPEETRAYLALLAPQVIGGSVSGPLTLPVAAHSWSEAPLFVMQTEGSSKNSPAPSDGDFEQPKSDTRMQDLTGLAPQSGGLFVTVAARDPTP